jgi:hypothetical protein
MTNRYFARIKFLIYISGWRILLQHGYNVDKKVRYCKPNFFALV